MRDEFICCKECGNKTQHCVCEKPRVSCSAPLPCSAKELPLANEFYLGLEWLGAWLVDHAEGETVSEELVVQWCNQAWAKHLLKPNRRIDGKH